MTVALFGLLLSMHLRPPMPVRCNEYARAMLSGGKIVAVRGAFSLAGYDGDLRTRPVASEVERIFVLPQPDVLALRDVRTLEQVLQQISRAQSLDLGLHRRADGSVRLNALICR